MHGEYPPAGSKQPSIWSLYPVPLFALLVVVLLGILCRTRYSDTRRL